MAEEQDNSQKTEDPTQKRLDEARKKGDVAKSQDVPAWFLLMTAAGIVAAFPTLRPAHVAWKWMDMIEPSEAKLVTASLLPSVEIMMSTLKYEIDYSLSTAKTRAVAKKLRQELSRA